MVCVALGMGKAAGMWQRTLFHPSSLPPSLPLNRSLRSDQEEAERLKAEMERTRHQVLRLQSEPVVFQSSRDSQTNAPLELPSGAVPPCLPSSLEGGEGVLDVWGCATNAIACWHGPRCRAAGWARVVCGAGSCLLLPLLQG